MLKHEVDRNYQSVMWQSSRNGKLETKHFCIKQAIDTRSEAFTAHGLDTAMSVY
jgi:hypothetical protein